MEKINFDEIKVNAQKKADDVWASSKKALNDAIRWGIENPEKVVAIIGVTATLVGVVVILGMGFYYEKKENNILKNQVDEQSRLIQLFGWPRTRTEYRNYSKGGESNAN